MELFFDEHHFLRFQKAGHSLHFEGVRIGHTWRWDRLARFTKTFQTAIQPESKIICELVFYENRFFKKAEAKYIFWKRVIWKSSDLENPRVKNSETYPLRLRKNVKFITSLYQVLYPKFLLDLFIYVYLENLKFEISNNFSLNWKMNKFFIV